MTDYTKTTNFTAKDSLPSGNANKIVKGSEIDDEFDNIATAVATKSNIASPTFTGTVTGPTIVATTAFVPDASDGAALGTTSLEFSDLFLADGSIIYFGADQDTTITHVADTGLLINSTRQLQFGDSGTYIHQSADGVLDLVSDTEIEINATTIDINGAADVSGNLAVGGNLTVTGNATIAGNLTFGDAASDTVAFSADVASNLLPSADNSYDLGASGSEWKDLYIDGTANIDSLVADTADINGGTVDGAVIGGSSAAAITGTAITGTSFVIGSATITEAELEILDGATVTTAELNILDGVTSTAAELNILDGVTSTAAELNILDGVTSTAAELNILDGATVVVGEINALDLGSTAVGTAIASKAVILDSNKDYTGVRNFTITGELDAATLDISGDADIDGTLEADAITVDGTTLAEYIADTAGAMFSSNTESGITVTYQDADNTVDLAVDAAQTGITSLLATDIKIGEDDQTKIDFETADEIHFYAANAEQVYVADGVFGPQTDSDVDLGTSSVEFKDLFLDGTAHIDTLDVDESATIAADLTVDTSTLKVDSSNNRVGIGNASPDVSLDIGSFTDAVHVPVGTTAQRPGSPAAGYFRYNSTTGQFEGYTDSWGAIGGGGGSAPVIDTMTGDNSDTTLSLSSAPLNENATFVTFDGVMQHKSTYSVSGSTLTFSTAPPTGVAVECITLVSTSSTTANQLLDADSDTKIQVEESSDEDTIRMDIAGTEVLTLTNSAMTLKGTTPTLTIGDAGAEDTKIVFDGNAQDYYIALDDSADDLIIGLGSTVGTTPIISVDENKDVAIPDGSLTITTGDNNNNLVLASTDADASFGPRLKLFRNSASAADGDAIGYINFTGTNDAGTPEEVGYAALDARIVDASDGTEDGRLEIVTLLAGVEGTSRILMDATETVFNDNSKDLDFRVESDTNTHAFFVQASDSTLGINTSSPLNVFDTQFSASAHTSGISITNQQNGGWGSALAFNSSRSDDSSIKTAARVRTEGAEAWGADSTTSSNLIFETRSDNTLAERMRITSAGEVLVGTTNASQAAGAGVKLISGTNGRVFVQGGDATSGEAYSLHADSAYRFYVSYSGVVNSTNTSISSISDERLKENIVGLETGLTEVMALKPRRFDWKDGEGTGEKNVSGFIAQEVEPILPDLIGTFLHDDLEDAKSIRTGDMIPTIIKAIQEQQTLIETLEAKVKALEEA